MVKIGNKYYFLYISIGLAVFFTLYFILRRLKQETRYKVLLTILFFNLGLHFLKLLFEPYFSDLPGSIKKITFENICAGSTIMFPFILLKRKNKLLNNYMYFIGTIGGLGALIFPTEAFNRDPFIFDVIRFYICHINLIIVPMLCVIFKIIELDYKSCLIIPVIFIFFELVIFVNELILMKSGLVEDSVTLLLDRNYRNSSFIFGPNSDFDNISWLVLMFVPKIFRRGFFFINGGVNFYWPIVWLVIPAFIYLPIFYLIITLPFTYHNIKNNFKERKIFNKKLNL